MEKESVALRGRGGEGGGNSVEGRKVITASQAPPCMLTVTPGLVEQHCHTAPAVLHSGGEGGSASRPQPSGPLPAQKVAADRILLL